MPHWHERAAFVAGAVVRLGATSLADVGCGEGRLIAELVRRRVPIPNLLGIDMADRALRKAARKVGAACAAQTSGNPAFRRSY